MPAWNEVSQEIVQRADPFQAVAQKYLKSLFVLH